MTCHQLLAAIDPYLDGELPVPDVLDVHAHLTDCESCRKVLESEAALRALVTADVIEDHPPDSLRARVLQRVGPVGSSPAAVRPRFVPLVLAGLGLAAVLVVAAVIAPGSGREIPAPLAAELAAKHLVYTNEPRPALTHTTADATEMSAWLKGRLGFAATLPRPSQPADRLVGGRASTVADMPAAYVLYEQGGRPISLFITESLPFAKLGWEERMVEGVEIYTAALGAVRLAWWEDEADHRLYAAAATASEQELVDFALLCVRSRRPSQPRRTGVVRRGRPDPSRPRLTTPTDALNVLEQGPEEEVPK
jgi:mycothiol system anti-sigma-R factor